MIKLFHPYLVSFVLLKPREKANSVTQMKAKPSSAVQSIQQLLSLSYRSLIILLITGSSLYSQAPVNDHCANALPIIISGGGFDLGTFVSAPSDLSNATVQPGEFFDSSIPLTLQSGTVWYSFTLPTARGCELLVEEPFGIDNFSSAFAGFALYYANTCFPGSNEIQQARLVPQGALGDSENPCLMPGDYLLQVVCNQAFNGPIEVTLTLTEPSPAPYDLQDAAGALGQLSACAAYLPFNAGCLTIDDTNEYFAGLGADSSEYTQSAWFTFTTPSAFDELAINVIPTSGYIYSTAQTAFGYNLYQGDVTQTNYSFLPEIDSGSDYSLYSAYANHPDFSYRCGELLPSTTYSIRLIFHSSLSEQIQLVVHAWGGIPAVAPVPTNIPSANDLGLLPAGSTSDTDAFGCNALMEINDCGSANPDTGVVAEGTLYNLSTWFTFELPSTSNISITGSCWSPAYNNVWLRLFDGEADGSCASLNYPSDLIMEGNNNLIRSCLPAGIYSVQLLGRSYDELTLYYWDICNYLSDGQLGRMATLTVNVVPTVDVNSFSLSTFGAFDPINGLSPLPEGLPVQSQSDVFGCSNTVMPDTTICESDYYYSYIPNRKAIYREFVIGDSDLDILPDSGIVTITGGNDYQYNYRLYAGSAELLGNTQGVANAGEWISGLEPVSECMNYANNDYCCNGFDYQVCVTPGRYTLVTFGDSTDIALSDQVTVQFNQVVNLFDSPAEANIMGDIWQTVGVTGGTVTSTLDHFGCHDNAESLNGVDSCGTKAIYREFYLNQASLVSITTNPIGCWYGCAYAPFTVFSGRVSQNISSLSALWTCVSTAATGPCVPLEAGWYSVVSYIDGPTYEDPLHNSLGTTGNGIGIANVIYVNVTPPGQTSLYNRPHKACVDAITGNPTLITWGPNEGDNHWISNDNTYSLCTEYFGCANDTPFTSHPIIPCNATKTKVAYYVFETTQISYLAINTAYFEAQLFDIDVRADSLLLPTRIPIQPCISGGAWNIQFCSLPPGVYTLVIWASDANYGQTVTPIIFIDEVSQSRFDFASKAYDFGQINPDNTWYNGKVGDVNPIDPSRAPSNDHFYCTTGAFNSDPSEMSCYTAVNDSVYSESVYNNMFDGPEYVIRRNIWYTFTLDGAGTCNVYIEPKPGKNVQRFAIYKSDVNGSVPFPTVQLSGQVDSTLTDGLTFVTGNLYSYWCYAYNEVSFYRDPCAPQTPTRYYVVVEHNGAFDALNSQCELRIKWDPLIETPVLYDHFSQANCINGLNEVSPPYTNVSLGAGTYTGDMDNFVCASADATDPYLWSCAPRTLWYYLDVAVTGYLKFRGQFFNLANAPLGSGTEIYLYREAVPGDSSSVVFESVPVSGTYDGLGYWNIACVSEGRYYFIFTGCSYLLHQAYPEIEIIEQAGDFCADPIVTTINGIGSSTASVVVDCHTIGQDFGETGNNMGCLLPNNASVTNYKSSWFRIDLTGTSSVNFTFQLDPALTTVNPSFVRYRILLGSCDAMNVSSCFPSSQTINTINCLAPGSYYLQLVVPEYYPWGSPVTGSVGFSFTTTPPTDPDCLPQNTCYAITSFTHVDDCESDDVQFLSQSTAGNLVDIEWQFGHNNATSSEENPTYNYPLLDVPATYTVILTVTNLECGESAADTSQVTIMPKPQFALPDTLVVCDSPGILLESNPSLATQITWPQLGTTAADTYWTLQGWNQAIVTGSIGSCSRSDTADVYISPIASATLGPDIVLCSADSIYIDANQYLGEQYQWSNGDTTSYSWLNLGTHFITWNYNGCSNSDTLTISDSETASPLGPDTLICIGLNGYMLDASTAGAYNYQWQDGSGGAIYLAPSAGTYWVDIYTPSCTLRDSVIITEPYFAPPIIEGSTILCQGDSITLSGPDGFSYLWSNTDTTQQLVVTGPGIYSLGIEDANSCQSSASIEIFQFPNPEPQINGNALICPNDSTLLSITSTFVEYAWSNGSSDAQTTISTDGWVYLSVIDDNGCSGMDSLEVSFASPSPVQFVGSTSFCEGTSTSLSLNTNYASYTWSNGTTDAQATFDQSGIVSVQATDYNGCVFEGDTLITEVANPVIQLSTDSLICIGQSEMLIATHDPGSLIWFGTGIDGLAADTAFVQQPGSYSVQITTLLGCSSVVGVIVEEQIISPQIDGTTILCEGDTTLLSGPVAAGYLWSTGDIGQQIVVSTAGDYTLNIIDAEGCSGASTIAVNVLPSPTPSIIGDLTFCQNDSTSLSADQSYQSYQWSNGSNDISTTFDQSGTVELTVTDQNNCTASVSQQLTMIEVVTPQFTGTFEFCEGDSTIISISPTYSSYEWSDGSVSPTIIITDSTSIEVIVTNDFGCSATADTIIVMWPSPELALISDSTVCSGGIETVIAEHSAGILNWSADVTAIAANDTLTISIPQTISAAVTDSHGCTSSGSIDVQLEEVIAQIIGDTSFCSGSLNTLSLSPAFAYFQWSTGATSPSIDIGVAGPISVNAVDIDGCVASASATLVEDFLPVVSITGDTTLCAGMEVTLQAIGTFVEALWSNGLTGSVVNINNTGAIEVTVTDANNCQQTATTAITLAPNLFPTIVGNQEACAGETITLSTNELFADYDWTGGNTGSNLEVTESGIYTLTVSDAEGCIGTAEEVVSFYANPIPEIVGNIGFCAGETIQLYLSNTYAGIEWNGSLLSDTIEVATSNNITVEVIDTNGCIGSATVSTEMFSLPIPEILGNPDPCEGTTAIYTSNSIYPYMIWNDSILTNEINLTNDSILQLSVTDSNGCSQSTILSVTFHQVDAPLIQGDTTFCDGTTATLLVTGAFDSLVWNTGDTNAPIQVNEPGIYSVEVFDMYGCSNNASWEIDMLPSPNFSIQGDTEICNGDTSLFSVLDAYITYLWSNGSTDPEIEATTEGAISLTVSGLNGCLAQESLWLTVHENPMPNIFGLNPACEGEVAFLNLDQNYTSIVWNTNETAENIQVNTPGTYSVEVENEFGCIGQTSFEQMYVPLTPLSIVASTGYCAGDSLLISCNSDFIQYIWNNTDGSNEYLLTGENIVELEATDANGCHSYDTLTLNVWSLPQPSILGNNTFCENNSTSLNTQNYSAYAWSTGENSPGIAVNMEGTITLEVTDSLGCSGSDEINITMIELPTTEIELTQTICMGETLEIPLRPEENINWYNGDTTSTQQFNVSDQYTFQISNACGVRTFELDMNVVDCESYIYIPNSFTPDNDGLNDAWKPVVYNISSYELRVFDRWGIEVFVTKDMGAFWDGNILNGAHYGMNDVYQYHIVYIEADGEIKELTGTVTLLR